MRVLPEKIDFDIHLPSPPAIAVRILEAVKKEETSSDELARIITADPALTSRILKVANSSFYALSSKVDSIQRALTVIGHGALKNIALSFVITGEMRGQSEDCFDFDFFWKRSVTTAVSGELISSLIGQKSDDIFVTALLQDIGIVIMYMSESQKYLQVLDEKKNAGIPVTIAETDIFGYDHQVLGLEVLRQWGLPACIYEPIGIHHNVTGNADDINETAEILYLSDKLSSIYHGTRCEDKMLEIEQFLNSRYNIDKSQIENLVDQVAEQSVRIMSNFEIDPGDMKPFSQMLQEANKELGKANLSYEQLVVELKKAKETAENLADELQKANEKLSELASKDGLTGLYNHRFFQQQMNIEVSRAIRYQRPLSFIMFDLDYFKKVNDQYGHPVGDMVLKAVADTVSKAVRKSDVVGRYGGEEFAIVLPETDLKGAVIFAERLRQRIEQLTLDTGDKSVSVTISLGLTTWEAGKPVVDKASIIKAADKALYKSKENGRNTISFFEPVPVSEANVFETPIAV